MWRADQRIKQLAESINESYRSSLPGSSSDDSPCAADTHIVVLLAFGPIERDIARVQKLAECNANTYIVTCTWEDFDMEWRQALDYSKQYVQHVQCDFKFMCERWTRVEEHFWKRTNLHRPFHEIDLPYFKMDSLVKHVTIDTRQLSDKSSTLQAKCNNYVKNGNGVLYVDPPFQKTLEKLAKLNPVSCSVHLDHFWLEDGYFRTNYGSEWFVPGGWCDYFLTIFKAYIPSSQCNFVTIPMDAAPFGKGEVQSMLEAGVCETLSVLSSDSSNHTKTFSLVHNIANLVYGASEHDRLHGRYLNTQTPFVIVTTSDRAADFEEGMKNAIHRMTRVRPVGELRGQPNCLKISATTATPKKRKFIVAPLASSAGAPDDTDKVAK